MRKNRSLDALVKARLREWPQHPPGLKPRPNCQATWLRGRPTYDEGSCHPFLKLPGSDRLRTLPDGLWLNFGGTPEEPFADIFAVEACISLTNLLDKRSRFAPSTHSLLAVCPVPWLLAPAIAGDTTPRWRATRLLRHEPVLAFILPVRDIRVLFALTHKNYDGFMKHQLPHAHEYYAPMETLMALGSDKNPQLRALLARATASANFIAVAPGTQNGM
jgi:hypothetical protein